MFLASIDLWDIIYESKEVPIFNVDTKVKKKYQRSIKKIMSIIILNLPDNQLTYIKS